jgi:acetate kinase
VEDVESALNRRSGLLGVSGISADMREVLAAARDGNASACLALHVYAHRVRQAIGGFTVTMDGIDALVFTGGVGENAAEVRADVCRGLGCLGVELDATANASRRPDADVTAASSQARVLLIAAREDIAMLSEVVRVIDADAIESRTKGTQA